MLDLAAIRKNPEEFKKNLARKGVKNERIDAVLQIDKEKRELQGQVEALSAQQNAASKEIPNLEGEAKTQALAKMKTISDDKKLLSEKLVALEKDLKEKLERLPNPPHQDSPDGKSDEENIVLRFEGVKPTFGFEPREHWRIGEICEVIDTERSARVSGARFYYLREELATLQRALMHWAFLEISKKGYSPTIPPFMTRREAIYGTGYLAKDENYVVNPGEDDLYLIGTSEVPMVSYHAGEVLDLSSPKKYVSYSPCFRREAGSYGKDTKGIFRVHQFEKVEMVVFCKPEDSDKIHAEILELEEHLLRELGIPYNVVDVCCGDLGSSATKKYDLEAWLPGQGQFREMTSTSICTDFQSRRLNIKYKDENGKNHFAHVLNGTAVSSRPLVAIMENFQTADGGFTIPEVLVPYCGGLTEVKPRKKL